MTTTLVVPEDIADCLLLAAQQSLETAGVLLASVVHCDNGDVRLLGRRLRWVNESAYIRREATSLSIASDGYVPALAEAETLGATPIWVHTHPGVNSPPVASIHDETVDREISDVFRIRSGSQYYGALIVSPRGDQVTFTGRLQSADGQTMAIDRYWIVGNRLRLAPAFSEHNRELPDIFDRNIRAFGAPIQIALSELRVAIVGCGGTGSSVAEQLVRLGVRQFTLIDPDILSVSNVTRVYGSTQSDVGQPKVGVVSRHLARIAPDTICSVVPAMITIERVARALTACDVVFGCTDDNAGRLILSRLSTYLLTPVIDCGVLLSSNAEGKLSGIDGRVTTLVPGQACLVCRGRIDLARAAAELLTPEERSRREDEGYAPALGRTEPAVVTFTSSVAAAAVSELLERLIDYGPTPRPSEVLLRFHDREISTNLAFPRDGHYCDSRVGKIGLGIATPFLEQAWPT